VEDFPWCADKDIVMKLSTDDGTEWSPIIVSCKREEEARGIGGRGEEKRKKRGREEEERGRGERKRG
jgi:hypothetical protein